MGLDVKGVTSNATPFVPLVAPCKVRSGTAVQHFRVGKDEGGLWRFEWGSCVASSWQRRFGTSQDALQRLLYLHFRQRQQTSLKSVECSCRKLWNECKVNSTSQVLPRYRLVLLLGSVLEPRTTPLSGPTPPLPQSLDDVCYQTWDPTVKFSDMDKYGT